MGTAAPVPSATRALVAEVAFAVGRDEDWDAVRERRGGPRVTKPAQANIPRRYALWQSVYREHAHWHGAGAGEPHTVLGGSLGISTKPEDDLATAVRNLLEVSCPGIALVRSALSVVACLVLSRRIGHGETCCTRTRVLPIP